MNDMSQAAVLRPSTSSLKRKRFKPADLVVWLVAIGSLTFASSIYFGYASLQRINHQAAMRTHSFEVLVLIEATEGAFATMEAAQRGFASTRDPAFLESFTRGRQWMRTVFPSMRNKVAAETVSGLAGASVEAHDEVDRMIERRVAQLDAASAASQASASAGSAGSADPISADPGGEVLMHSLRESLDRMRATQRSTIASNEAVIAAVNQRFKWVCVLSAMTGVMLLGLSLWALSRERLKHKRADAKLRSFNLALEATVSHRTQELRQAGERIRVFATALDRNIEAERRRLAREVHDQIGQVATGMKMIVMRLGQTHPELEHGPVRELAGLLDEAVATARHIAAELRPPLLDDLGLEAAVDHYASQSARQSGLSFRVDVRDDEILSPGQANQLFRILQEAVTNVLRHAHATEVEIHGAIKDGEYVMTVRDDGKGVQQMRKNSSGLLNMRERALMAHGWLKLAPAEGGGTVLTAAIPVDAGVNE